MSQAQKPHSAGTPEQESGAGIMSHEETTKQIDTTNMIEVLKSSPLYRERMMNLHETLLKVQRGEI